MDIREQYRINPNLIMGGLDQSYNMVPKDRTAVDQFSSYGRNRFARNLEPSFTQKLGMGIPSDSVFDYIPYVGTIKKFAEKFGPTNIKDFYT